MTKTYQANAAVFNNLKARIENWAEERGIYQHSTPAAQLLKTVSEIGELADAHIKGDFDAFTDAIGDVTVCVINWARMQGLKIEPPMCEEGTFEVEDGIANLLHTIANWLLPIEKINLATKDAQDMLDTLVGICATIDGQGKPILFTGCLELAWGEIKDRKGRMVAGGAFVKED